MRRTPDAVFGKGLLRKYEQIYEAGTADAGFGPQHYFAMEFFAVPLSETTGDPRIMQFALKAFSRGTNWPSSSCIGAVLSGAE